MRRREYLKSYSYVVRTTVETLGISYEEAVKRVDRVLNFPGLNSLGGPDSKEYQIAVDIMMQIPSRLPINKETMDEVVKRNRKQ